MQPSRLTHASYTLPLHQVAVALMRKMAVPPGEPAAAQAQIFARSLHDAWGVGDAACNNGVLLLLSIEDRQVGWGRSLCLIGRDGLRGAGRASRQSTGVSAGRASVAASCRRSCFWCKVLGAVG